jgi:hypothetical protein
MKRVQLVGNLVAGVLLALAATSVAHAQATRTWVSGVGDDANPCSRTAPCKTFAGAISKTLDGGEINCLDPGGFGAVTITKSIKIDCGTMPGGVLVSGTSGIIINATTNSTVILRGLEIFGVLPNNAGAASQGINGIRYLAAKAVHLENVHIAGFTTNCIDMETGTTAGQLTIANSALSECGTNGIRVLTTNTSTAVVDITGSRIFKSTNGISAENGSRITVRDSDISLNASFGVLQSSPAAGGGNVVAIDSSTMASNGTALKGIAGSFIGAFRNVFTGNGLVYNANGGTINTGSDNIDYGNTGVGAAAGVPKI